MVVSNHYWASPASVVKNSPANAGDTGSRPGSGRSLGEGNGNPLQNSCWGNPMNRGAWWAIVHGGRKELDTTEHTHAVITIYPQYPLMSTVWKTLEIKTDTSLVLSKSFMLLLQSASMIQKRNFRGSHWSEWPSLKSLQITNAGESVEKREPSYIFGVDVTWCSHYGKQCGGSSENSK